MFLPKFLLLYFSFVSAYSLNEICTTDNCRLPSCQCPKNKGNPTSFKLNDLPQFVLLTFTGNINSNTLEPIRSILNSSHRNPNKCPISSTFFTHDINTDYCLVQRLFDNQNEIAMTTSNNKCPLTNCYDEYSWHRWTNDDWHREIKQQKFNLIQDAQLHQTHIKGFRVPHLQIDQNQHFEYLQKYQFHYDSSMLFKSSNLMWPFTLDYPYNIEDCVNCYAWNKSYEALWQFPLHELHYPNSQDSCRTLSDSSCLPVDREPTADIYFYLLMYNFERHLSSSLGHRSPFQIELDLNRLSRENDEQLKGILYFIKYILNNSNYRHVYFISIEKALEWLKYPRSLEQIRDFWAFKCNDKFFEYSADCFNENEQDLSIMNDVNSLKSNKNSTSSSSIFDRQAEKLFPSTIALHALWISIVILLSVLFYDRYLTKKS